MTLRAREMSFRARDEYEGCDVAGEVARAECGVRARAMSCARGYYFLCTLNGIWSEIPTHSPVRSADDTSGGS